MSSQFMYIICNDQVMIISLSVTSDICCFFVLGTFNLLLPVLKYLTSCCHPQLLCCRTTEVIPSIQLHCVLVNHHLSLGPPSSLDSGNHQERKFLVFQFLYVNENVQYLSFCAWLISLNITSSRFIHVATNERFSFLLWFNNIPLCVCVCVHTQTTFSLSIHPSLGTQVGFIS